MILEIVPKTIFKKRKNGPEYFNPTGTFSFMYNITSQSDWRQ